MAQTLASGVVIPAPGDRISASGVQEMRTLGASVDTGLALTQAQVAQVDAQSRARDADLADQVAGMEGMTYVGAWESGRTYRINDVVTHGGDSWARLTAGSAGEPGASPTDWGLVARKGDGGGFGELTETSVPGLWEGVDVGVEARLAPLEQDTGDRDITSLVPNLVAGSGHWTIRRAGRWVYMNLYNLTFTPTSGSTWIQAGFLPVGFRPPAASQYIRFPAAPSGPSESTGPFRVDRYGGVTIYNANGGAVHVTASWPTNDAFPTTLPGDPA